MTGNEYTIGHDKWDRSSDLCIVIKMYRDKSKNCSPPPFTNRIKNTVFIAGGCFDTS